MVVLAGVLSILVEVHERTISAREPLALEDLNTLAEKLETALPWEFLRTTQTEGNADPEPDESILIEPPARLERVASPEDLEKRFLERAKSPRPTTVIRVKTSKAFTAALWAIGAEEEALNLTCKIGCDLMALGKWEEARRYFREVLHEAKENSIGNYWVRRASHNLAWLETDPERAAQLLKVSCRGAGANWNLAYAVDLAEATGTEVLANHYFERLRSEAPITARQYEEKREEMTEQGNRPNWNWRQYLYILPDN